MRPRLQAEIGRRLRAIRRLRGLTQKGLARRTEGTLDYSYIGKVERGEQLPSLKLLERLGKALHVPVSYFFEETKGGPVAPELSKAMTAVHQEDVPLLLEIVRVLGRYRQQGAKIRREPSPAKVAEAQGQYRGGLQELQKGLEGVIKRLRRSRLAGRPKIAEVLEELERVWRRLSALAEEQDS
ncbi:MAG: helix-turn-helix domain-containing protein [Candidatus Methylomirabilales bacterium]